MQTTHPQHSVTTINIMFMMYMTMMMMLMTMIGKCWKLLVMSSKEAFFPPQPSERIFRDYPFHSHILGRH
jgi:hypothetical protein